MTILSGRLRVRVDIQRPVTVRNELGEKIETWQTVVSRRIEPSPVNGSGSGAEAFNHEYQMRAVSLFIVRMRWERALRDLSPAWRMVDGDTIYEIDAVDNTRQMNHEFVVKAVVEH